MPGLLKSISFILSLGIVAIIIITAASDLSAAENGLLSTMLMLLSIVVTIIVAYFFSLSSQSRALKVFAQKASEKVNNLSKELARLSGYLQYGLDNTEFDTIEQTVLSREEHIASTIHIIQTLKSMNDTSLSDWRGVIGEEIEQQIEEREKRDEELSKLTDRLENIFTMQNEFVTSTKDESFVFFKNEIESLREDLNILVTSISGKPYIRRKPTTTRNIVNSICPECGNEFTYKQKGKKRSVKAVNCPSCETKYLSRYNKEKGIYELEVRKIEKEVFNCPECLNECHVELDLLPSSNIETVCTECKNNIRVIRTSSGLHLKILGSPSTSKIVLKEEIVEKVKDSLPPQPWPKGISEKIASDLKLSKRVISMAISELIRRGEFKFQIGGKLFVEETGDNKT